MIPLIQENLFKSAEKGQLTVHKLFSPISFFSHFIFKITHEDRLISKGLPVEILRNVECAISVAEFVVESIEFVDFISHESIKFVKSLYVLKGTLQKTDFETELHTEKEKLIGRIDSLASIFFEDIKITDNMIRQSSDNNFVFLCTIFSTNLLKSFKIKQFTSIVKILQNEMEKRIDKLTKVNQISLLISFINIGLVDDKIQEVADRLVEHTTENSTLNANSKIAWLYLQSKTLLANKERVVEIMESLAKLLQNSTKASDKKDYLHILKCAFIIESFCHVGIQNSFFVVEVLKQFQGISEKQAFHSKVKSLSNVFMAMKERVGLDSKEIEEIFNPFIGTMEEQEYSIPQQSLISSSLQRNLVGLLSNTGLEVIPEYFNGVNFIDIVVPSAKIAIEIDGNYHFVSSNAKSFQAIQNNRTALRDHILKTQGFEVHSFHPSLGNQSNILEKLHKSIEIKII